MPYLDLSHPINEATTVYPGTPAPELQPTANITRDGFAERRISFYSHTGTHIDAPCHILPNTKSLDQFAVDKFVGKAMLIDCADFAGQLIPLGALQPKEKDIAGVDFVIFRSGWSQKWTSPDYFHRYPILSSVAAQWLAGFALKGIGLDMISPDTIDSTVFSNHHILLAKEILIIENLCNLEQLPTFFDFQCLPMPLAEADGAPVRAVAWF